MTAEIRSAQTELNAVYRPEFCRPAQLILSTPGARQVFSDFMWQYVGDPNVPACFRQEVQPVVTRAGRESDAIITYRDTCISGYTGLGSLVHVRENRAERHEIDRYYVAIGDLRTGEMSERHVVASEYQRTVQGGLEGRLYLDHPDNGNWPKQYWPTIRLTQQGYYYSLGFEQREERVGDIMELFETVAEAEASRSHLRSLE